MLATASGYSSCWVHGIQLEMELSLFLPLIVLLFCGPITKASVAYIVISPEDLTTSQGHTLLLPCVVAAHDPNNVQVTWRQNGHSVDPVATPHLEVHTLMVSERGGVMFVKSVLEVCVTGQEARGNYTCTATNGQDVLDQQVFHISVDPRPAHILVAPGDMNITQSNSPTVAIQCIAMGTPHPHITWLRNSHALTGDSGLHIQEDIVMRNEVELVVSTLLICPSRVRGGGHYTCKAQNQYSHTEASFAVRTPAVIAESLSSPATQNVTMGQGHMLTCAVLGYPPPVLRWTLDDQPITDDTHFAIDQQTRVESLSGVAVTTSHLSFTVHSTRFAGRYKCLAVGNALHVREYHLQVQVPANIMIAPVGPGHGLTSSVIVSCVAYGLPAPTVTWKHGASIVSDSLMISRTQQLSSQDSSVAVVSSILELCPIQEDVRSGEYSCEVENGVGGSTVKSASFHLCFIGNFGLLVAPTDQDIVTGGVYFLACVAFSRIGRAVEITWSANGNRITGEASRHNITEKSLAESGVRIVSSILEISCASLEDAMEYSCSATDGTESKEEKFVLCFSSPPVIEVQSDEKGLITKQHNDNLTLFCVVSGCRTPNVTWLKNGVPLERDKGFSVEEVWFGEIGRTFVNSTLTLSGLTLDDNGYYVCRAENTLAQVDLEEGYTLSVNGVPGTPAIVGPPARRNKAVEYSSYIGSILCILPLIAVVIIFLSCKNLRSKMEIIPLLNFCIAISLLYLSFIPSSNVHSSDGVCALLSSLFHLSFLLAAFSCLSLVALRPLSLYNRAKGPLSLRAKLAYTLTLILNWGLPVLCLVTSLAPDVDSYSLADHACVPQKRPLWFGLLLPFALSHAVSWIIVLFTPFVVSPAACRFRDALAMGSILLLFDLAWVLQILALSVDTTDATTATFQSIFVVSSACLGTMSLVYFCFLQPHAREALRQCTSNNSSEGDSSPMSEKPSANGSVYATIIDENFVGRESGVVSKVADL